MNSIDQDLVTVVVATFNHEAYIAETLSSIFEQETDIPFHVLVHDDASTDGTQEILRQFKLEYEDQLTLVLQPENIHSRGNSISWELLRRAETKYVAFCEGDDFWVDRHKLEKQTAFMESREWCSISHHDVSVVNEVGDQVHEQALEEMLSADSRRAERTEGTLLAHGNFIMTCSVMIRRAAIRDEVVSATGGFWPQDFIIFSVACEVGDIGFVPDTMSSYRLHSTNSWASLDSGVKDNAYTSVFYFLAAHLAGRMQYAARSALIERLLAGPIESKPPSLGKYLSHVDGLEAGMVQIRADIAQARLAREQAEGERDEARGQNNELRRTVKSLKKQLAHLRASSSWRATAPMRRVAKGVKSRTRVVPGKRGSK